MQDTTGVCDLFLDSPSLHLRVAWWKINRPSHIYLSGKGGLFPLPPHRGSCLSLPDPPQSSAFTCTFPNHVGTWLPPVCCMWSAASRRENEATHLHSHRPTAWAHQSQGRPQSIKPTHQDVSLQWLLTTAVLFYFPAFFPRSVCISAKLWNWNPAAVHFLPHPKPKQRQVPTVELLQSLQVDNLQLWWRAVPAWGTLVTSAPCI